MDRQKMHSFESFERRYEEKEYEQRQADRNAFKKAQKQKKKIEEQKKAAAAEANSKKSAPPPSYVAPPDTKRKDMLHRLGLMASEVDPVRIKIAYKSLALKLHPDKNGGQDAEFKKILEAYEYLCAK